MATTVQGKPPWSCADCGTTTTPVRRSGPDGPSTLCNACGLRLAKRIKDAGGLSIRERKKLAGLDGILKTRKKGVRRWLTGSITEWSGERNSGDGREKDEGREIVEDGRGGGKQQNRMRQVEVKSKMEIEREEIVRKRKAEQAVALEKANGLREKMQKARERDLQRNPLLKNPRTMTSDDHWERALRLKQMRQQMSANWPTNPASNANITVNSNGTSSNVPNNPIITSANLNGEESRQSRNAVTRSDVIEALANEAKEAKKGAWAKLNYPLGSNLLTLRTMQSNGHLAYGLIVPKQEGVLDNTSQGMSSTTGGSFCSDRAIEDAPSPTSNGLEMSSSCRTPMSFPDDNRPPCQRAHAHDDLTRRLDAIQAKSNTLLKSCDLLLARNREMKANIANDRRAIMALSVDARKLADQFKRTPGP